MCKCIFACVYDCVYVYIVHIGCVDDLQSKFGQSSLAQIAWGDGVPAEGLVQFIEQAIAVPKQLVSSRTDFWIHSSVSLFWTHELP